MQPATTTIAPQIQPVAAPPYPGQYRLATTAWCVTIAILLTRLLPFAVQPGMDLDGTMYAAISRNIASGFGDLWHPAFSPGAGARYFENPPLAFLLQSYVFRVCGDHFWVEKFYSAATGLIAVLIVVAIWRRLVEPHSPLLAYSWLPIILWLAWSGWTWQYENNWLENTLTVFAGLAVYCALCAADNSRIDLKWIILGAMCMLAGVLSKGPVGLYPLATPLIAWLTLRRQSFRAALAATAASLAVLCALLALLLLQPAARDFLSRYFDQQIIASLSGKREHAVAWGQFFILKAIKNSLKAPAEIASAIVLLDFLRRGFLNGQSTAIPTAAVVPPPTRALFFCLATAASASLPIMVSPKQWSHYAFPSYPFYALALAFWCAPSVVRLINSRNWHAWLQPAIRAAAAAACIVLAIASIELAGRPDMDPDQLHDTFVLQSLLPSATVVGVSDEMSKDWPFFAYLSRWNNVGVDHQSDHRNQYFLTRSGDADSAPADYVVLPTVMSKYRLFRRSGAAELSAAGSESRLSRLPRIGTARASR